MRILSKILVLFTNFQYWNRCFFPFQSHISKRLIPLLDLHNRILNLDDFHMLDFHINDLHVITLMASLTIFLR